MEIFRDLFIRGDADQLAATMDEVERSLPQGWARDQQAESRVRFLTVGLKPTYCFTFEDELRPAASLFLTEKEPGLICVVNLVPRDKHQLSFSEYNAVLEDFHERCVRPCAEKTGARVELTSNQADLRHWLTETTAKKLRTFSAMANKSTGSSHPKDQERWMDFITTSHREGSRLDAPSLRRWLIEIEGWPPEVADQLVGEYEFGRELLAFPDGHRRGA
jgi:hypothetical protein